MYWSMGLRMGQCSLTTCWSSSGNVDSRGGASGGKQQEKEKKIDGHGYRL
jgi:hypothetical protein